MWRARSSGFSVEGLQAPAPANPQKCSDRRSPTLSGIARPGFRWPLEPRWRPAARPRPIRPRTQQTSAHLTNQTSQRSEESLTSATSCREEPVFPDLPALETQHTSTPAHRRRESRGPPPGSRCISRPPNNPHTQHRASDAKLRALGFGRVGHQNTRYRRVAPGEAAARHPAG